MKRKLLTYITFSFLIICFGCSKKTKDCGSLFEILSSDQSGIQFNNKLHETDSLNILSYLYYYNGGGVAAGDLNNDGLPELYFSGNEVDNRLYLNTGEMRFKDITEKAGVSCKGSWNTGISMVDINADGWLDIYVCQVNKPGVRRGANQLFINNRDLTFTESAAQHGLAFSGLGTHAAFFDYDRDGDLDCYLLNHSIKDPEQFKPASVTRQMTDLSAGDMLLQNNNGFFTDVSVEAGISRSWIGFGLGIDIGDLNRDGWPDIYVGNDFHENDYLYLNNRNGTFHEVIENATGHTSNFTMGVSIADINNDTWPDILSLDMKPEDEKTYKLSGGWESFNIYHFKRSFGYHHQSPRNALQINQGMNHEVPVFSELACQYGIEATDWSWSPLIADFNTDGYKDIFISNGIERRPNDIDFINYYSNESLSGKTPPSKMIRIMPAGGAGNYLFLNGPTHNFKKVSIPDLGSKITTGATYCDLDRDGDLDIICNNLNHVSYIVKNNNPATSFVSVQLKDTSSNTFALGAQVTLYQGPLKQYQYINHTSGFESGKEAIAYFGTKGDVIDSIRIQWPDGQCEIIKNITSTFLVLERNESSSIADCNTFITSIQITNISIHTENTPGDIETEKWIPFSLSTFGPRIAIGKKHYYITGAQSPGDLHLIINDKNVSHLLPDTNVTFNLDENDAAFGDFNNDGIEDLYISIGGNVISTGDNAYRDRLYFGSADGTFKDYSQNLPQKDRCSSVVRPFDFDHDGDLDVFVGTLSRPGNYGWSEPSILYVNNGRGNFTLQEMPVWEMVFDAQWQDMNHDSLPDLVVVGHWMPVTILYNQKTHWDKKTIPGSEGLWFSVQVTHLNQDDIPDIMAGNFGLNHPFEADSTRPMILYLNDFDLNGQSDPILTYVHDDKRYLYPNLEIFLQQLPGRKKDFVFNKNFAGKPLTEIFTPAQLDKSMQRKCSMLSSGVFFSVPQKNNWDFMAFPPALQHSPLWAIQQIDTDAFAFGGNFFIMDPNWGRQDAMFLTFMKINNDGSWTSLDDVYKPYLRRSEIRDLQLVNDRLYIASNNDTIVSIPLEYNLQ